jgi:hypothetical protein
MSPIPAPQALPPYSNLEIILFLARTRMNDAVASIGGDILTDQQPFFATMVNAAWRNLQTYLTNLGYSRYKRKFFGFALPVTATLDPSQPNIWTWSSFFDGTSFFTPPTSVLPNDMISPLYLRERITGSNSQFSKMQYMPDGLIECRKHGFNRQWEWKNDSIYIPGSLFSMDFEVEYAAFDADFTVTDNVLGNPNAIPPLTPSNMPVPIMRCESAFANFLCAEAGMGRDDVDVPTFIAAAQNDAKLIMNNEVKLKQRTPVQRRSYSRGGSRFYGNRY